MLHGPAAIGTQRAHEQRHQWRQDERPDGGGERQGSHVTAPRTSQRRLLRHAASHPLVMTPDARAFADDEQRRDEDELRHRQHRRGSQVEEFDGEGVDLRLERRVAQATEHEDDAERRRAEQKHDARGADDGGAQLRPRHRPEDLPR